MLAVPDTGLMMWLVFAIIALTILFYSLEKVPLEATSLVTLTALVLLFYIAPRAGVESAPDLGLQELLAGFSDPALVAIVGLLIVGQALVQTGALEGVTERLIGWSGKAPTLVVAMSLLFVLLLSGVLNNTPVVVIFIPIMTALAERMHQSASRLLLPLSYAAILGGNITLIGSSTNLLVSGSLDAHGGGRIDFFAFAVPGLILAGVGLVYVLLVAPRLLGHRNGGMDAESAQRGQQFLVEVEVDRNSKFNRQKAVSGLFPGLPNITIRNISRHGQQILPPYDDIVLRPGDVVTFAATRRVLRQLFIESPTLLPRGVDLQPSGAAEEGPQQPTVAEAVVAPASRMEGRTAEHSGFLEATHCAIIGVQRRARMLRQALSTIRLEAGDVLLVVGQRQNVQALRNNRDVLLLEWSTRELVVTDHSFRALMIFALVVALAASKLLPIAIAALIGVVLSIVGGCLNIRQAVRAIDRRVVLIIVTALAMGTAMEQTGGAAFLAHGLISQVASMSPTVILGAMFLLVATMTNILSNNATAVLFTPIALSLADGLGLDPMPFLVCVIFAANSSFATPIGYQTNLLVMAPGHYKFADYVKVGVPLILLLWAAFLVVVPWYYGLH
ncbi:MAG: SLC13 family permease [Sphingomonadales bacterium]